jgi:hypothetical protein
MTKEEIKQDVIKKLDDFCKSNFVEIELNTEGSLTESNKYLSLNNVKLALEMCFEETYRSK